MPNVIVKQRYYGPSHPRRLFYACNQTEDYLRYIDKGGKAGAKYKDYLNYTGKEEKSGGIFNSNGLMSAEHKKELRKKLQGTQSIIWDMVISFEEEYGKTHICDSDDARELLNAQLGRFFRKAGLNPNNITWYAGLHTNTDNTHIHVSYFENEPQRFRQQDRSRKYYHSGNVSKRAFDKLKFSIELYFSTAKIAVKEQRKKLLQAADNMLQNNVSKNRRLRLLLIQLYEQIPLEGRIGYDSENMRSIKVMTDEITTLILTKEPYVKDRYEDFKQALKAQDDETREFSRQQKLHDITGYLIADKTIADLYRRIGNKVIQRALMLKREKRSNKRMRWPKKHKTESLENLVDEMIWDAMLYLQACEEEYREWRKLQEELAYEM